MLTPYISATKIDTDKVNDFIHNAYKEAGHRKMSIPAR
jgi:ethanolamine utilization protein EutA (predicted chaperonin)